MSKGNAASTILGKVIRGGEAYSSGGGMSDEDRKRRTSLLAKSIAAGQIRSTEELTRQSQAEQMRKRKKKLSRGKPDPRMGAVHRILAAGGIR